MSEMVRRAVDEIPDMRGQLDDDDKAILARRVLNAALDPHDSELQAVILRAMGFYSEGGDFGPMARVQAHDAIAALKAFAAQGESGLSRERASERQLPRDPLADNPTNSDENAP